MKTKVVLVTGVSGYWGAKIAQRLCLEPGIRVIGLDARPPAYEIEGMDYVDVDPDNPLMPEFLAAEGVDAICHLKFRETEILDSAVRDENVNGTRSIVKAAAKAAVGQIVIKSSTFVYGAHADNPAFLTEQMPLRGSLQYGYSRDMLEIESIISDFQHLDIDVRFVILRFANIVGPTCSSPLTRLLSQPAPPVLLGFDPVFQLIHEQDAVEAMAYAVLNNSRGTYNVAAQGVIPLSRLMKLARKVPLAVFHPLAYRALERLVRDRNRGLAKIPMHWDYLRYPWIADIGRLHQDMGFVPIYPAGRALLEFAGRWQLEETEVAGEELNEEVIHLRRIIEQRRKERAFETSPDISS